MITEPVKDLPVRFGLSNLTRVEITQNAANLDSGKVIRYFSRALISGVLGRWVQILVIIGIHFSSFSLVSCFPRYVD